MKKIIKATYFHRFLNGEGYTKYSLVDHLEGIEKLQEQEMGLVGKFYQIQIIEVAVEIAKFLSVDNFKSTELIEFINIMDFIRNDL